VRLRGQLFQHRGNLRCGTRAAEQVALCLGIAFLEIVPRTPQQDLELALGFHALGLIDGELLTKPMVRFNVAVRIAQTIEIKRIDLDYFEDAETE